MQPQAYYTISYDPAVSIRRLPFRDQRHLLREMNRSPEFGRELARIFSQPEPLAALHQSSMRAALNELDPSRYPESTGQWLVLRHEIRQLGKVLPKVLKEIAEGLTFKEKLVLLDALKAGQGLHIGMSGMEGMGFLGPLLGVVLPAIISVGGGFLTANIQAKVTKSLGKTKLRLEAAYLDKKLAVGKELAEKKMFFEAALARETLEKTTIIKEREVVPGWTIPAAIGGGLVVLYLLFK